MMNSISDRRSEDSDIELGLLEHAAPAPSGLNVRLGAMPPELNMDIYEHAAAGAAAGEQHKILQEAPALYHNARHTSVFKNNYLPDAQAFITFGRKFAEHQPTAEAVKAALSYAVAAGISIPRLIEETKSLEPHLTAVATAQDDFDFAAAQSKHTIAVAWRNMGFRTTIPISALYWMVLTPSIPATRHLFYSNFLLTLANNVGISVGVALGTTAVSTLAVAGVEVAKGLARRYTHAKQVRPDLRAMRQITGDSPLTALEKMPEVASRLACVEQYALLESQGGTDAELQVISERIAAIEASIQAKL